VSQVRELWGPVIVHHPTDTALYYRLAGDALPGVPLQPCYDRRDLETWLPEAEVVFGWRIPRDCYRLARRLAWLQGMGAGIEDLVNNPDLRPEAQITRVVGIFGPWIAEYTLAQILAWRQDIARSRANQAAHRWDKFLIRKARGLRLGVAGLGSVGQEVARLGQAMGLFVSAYDLAQGELTGGGRVYSGGRGSAALMEFMSGIDVLSINLPLTPDTRGLFGARELAAMPRGSYLVNTARGPVVDEQVLVAAIRTGHLSGAALDVFDVEPLPVDSPLWDISGVTITSHISGPSTPAEVVPIFVDNYHRFRRGEPLIGLVDRARGF
jgi:glyoxylate/hydroxypyruvate reductase A